MTTETKTAVVSGGGKGTQDAGAQTAAGASGGGRGPELSRTQNAPAADTRGERTILTGKVTSAKMEKTIVVQVTRLVQHPKYHRVVRITKKFYAHDEKRAAKQGDTVRIVASRPLSRLKRWRLKEVLTRNASAQ
jgi:small subunit ribosomal protein S17